MRVEAAIINALKTVGMPKNITSILADRDGVEPKAPYLIIQIIDTENLNLPRKTLVHEDGNIKESLFQTKEYDVALTFHASSTGDTHDWVEYFHDGLFSDMVDWSFTQQGLGVVSDGGLMYQSQPVNGTNYKRAILSIKLRAETLNQYTVNAMQGVEVKGDNIDSIIGKTGEFVVDVNFNE